MNGWTTARQGLTLIRRATIGLGIAIVLVLVTGGATLTVVAAVLAALVLAFGSLLFTLGLPESEARTLAMRGLWVGIASAVLRGYIWFAADPWSHRLDSLDLVAEGLGLVALLFHFAAWKSAALARSSSEAATRAGLARGFLVAGVVLSAYQRYELRTSYSGPSQGLTLVAGLVGLVALVTWWRALTALETALDDRVAYGVEDEVAG